MLSVRPRMARCLQRTLFANRTMPILSRGPGIRFFSDYPDHIRLEMPALSPTMEKGNIASWSKAVGDRVEAGDVVAEVETDKATVAFESIEEGYMARILVEEGSDDLPVGTLVAILAEEEADIVKFANYVDTGAIEDTTAPVAATPAPVAATLATPATPAAAPAQTSQSSRVVASPRARMLAREKGIDLSLVQGTGPDRRVVAADVEEYKGAATATATAAVTAAPVAAAAAAPTPAAAAAGNFEDIPLTNMRKIIASRLLQSKQQIPHYYLTIESCMDSLLATRAKLNANREKANRLSVNDFIVKASAAAMKEVPEVNSSWMEDEGVIRQFNYVDVCVAVSTPTGLITPIVKDCDAKGLADISADTKDLATRARVGKLDPSEYQGGTFTISNLGMFGINHFTAIINPPQAAILAVGTSVEKVVPNPARNSEEDPEFITKSYMSVTLSCDHRVIDGAVGSQWLQAFKRHVEDPLTMLL